MIHTILRLCACGPIVFLLAASSVFPAPGLAAPPPRLSKPTKADEEHLKELWQEAKTRIFQEEWWAAERTEIALIQQLSKFLDEDQPEHCRQRVSLAGTIYHGQGRLTEAEKMLRPTVEQLARFDGQNHPDIDSFDYPQALYLLAQVEFELRNEAAAGTAIESAIDLLSKRTPGDKALAHKFNDLKSAALKLRGLIRGTQGDYLLARADFELSLQLKPGDSMKDDRFRATLYNSIAITWLAPAEQMRTNHNLGQSRLTLAKADSYLRNAEKLCKPLDEKDAANDFVKRSVATTRTMVDTNVRLLDDPTIHFPLNVTSPVWFALSPHSPGELDALMQNEQAVLNLAAGRYQQADDGLSQGIRKLGSGAIINPQLLALLQLNQAVLRAIWFNRVDDATSQIEKVLDQLYERSRKSLATQSLRQQFVSLEFCEQSLSLYVSLAMKAGRPVNKIYDHVFRWKGILFAIYPKGNLSKQLNERFGTLTRTVAEAQTVVDRCLESNDSTTNDRRLVHERLENAQRALAEFSQQHSPTEDLGTELATNFAERLEPGTVFLDFVTYAEWIGAVANDPNPKFKTRYLAFVISAGHPPEIRAIPLSTSVPELNDKILRWRDMLPAAAANASVDANLWKLTQDISAAIWGPLEPICRNARLLWVCPTQALWGFPFAALSQTIPTEDQKYLIQRVPIAYVPAARLALQLLMTRPFRAVSEDSWLVVDDIAYAEGVPRIGADSPSIAALKRRVAGPKSVFLTDLAANRTNFLKHMEKSGHNVCFVGHGICSPLMQHKWNSLLLQPTNPETAAEPSSNSFQLRLGLAGSNPIEVARSGLPISWDKYLSDVDLFAATPTSAERFELWGCWTLLGRMAPIEGLIGFPRTLLLAGYRVVIAAQWNVPEDATLPIIASHFHVGLLDQKLGDAMAMQQAQCDAIAVGDVNASPLNWAAWVVVGDPGPFTQPMVTEPYTSPPMSAAWPGRTYWLFAAGALLLTTALFLIRWYSRPRHSCPNN